MSILSIILLVGALVLLFLILFNVPVSQKLLNALFLILLIILIVSGSEWNLRLG
jgi:hypothetical protein